MNVDKRRGLITALVVCVLAMTWSTPAFAADPLGVVTTFGMRTTGISAGGGSPSVQDGNLWVAERGARHRPRDACRRSPVDVLHRRPRRMAATVCRITAGPDGNLWFTEQADEPDRADHPGRRVTEFRAGIDPTAAARDRRRARRQPLVHRAPPATAIGRITPAGVVTEFRGPTPPRAAASPPDPTATSGSPRPATDRAHHAGGVVDAAVRGRRHPTASPPAPTATSGSPIRRETVGRITTAGPSRHSPTRLAGAARHRRGPDGNLWFTRTHGGQIGRVTTAGAVERVHAATPRRDGATTAVAAGPDGNLWFTDSANRSRGSRPRARSRSSTPVPQPAMPTGHRRGHRRQPLVHRARGEIGRITPGRHHHRVPDASPASPAVRDHGRARTATSGSPRRPATGSGGSRRPGSITEFPHPDAGSRPAGDHGRARRQPLVHRAQSGNQIGADHARPRRDHRVHRPAHAGQRSQRDRRRARRQPLVHRDSSQPDRPHHPATGADHRVRVPTAGSRPGDHRGRPTATSGSPSSRRPDRPDHAVGPAITEFADPDPRCEPSGHRGGPRRQPLVHRGAVQRRSG